MGFVSLRQKLADSINKANKEHNYLNENLKIHVIFGFCYKIIVFRDLTKLPAIALIFKK